MLWRAVAFVKIGKSMLTQSSVQRVSLHAFRNYPSLSLDLADSDGSQGAEPPGIIALVGPNGAGKTNLLEALSLFSPGRGLRGSGWTDFPWRDDPQGPSGTEFAVSLSINSSFGERQAGLGVEAGTPERRSFRLDGQRARGVSAFGEFLAFVWLTPQQDGLFRGSSEERRRFLDQLCATVDPGYASELGAFQNSARQRLKLLKDELQLGIQADPSWLNALEDSMARHAVTVGASRRSLVRRLGEAAEKGFAPFPGARLALEGEVERLLEHKKALEAEDELRARWADERAYDARYGRTHTGPNRSDLAAWHSEHGMPARDCSTGEQKAMLIAIILAHANVVEDLRLVRPILLLDEATAHLDQERRRALVGVLERYGGQCWMTGTELGAFPGLGERPNGGAEPSNHAVFLVQNGTIMRHF